MWSATTATGRSTGPVWVPEVKHHLLEPVLVEDDVAEVLDRDVVARQPRTRVGHEGRERRDTPDPPAHGVVQLGFAGERLDQRIEPTGQQPVVVGHGHEGIAAALVEDLLEDRSTEELGDPWHDVRSSGREGGSGVLTGHVLGVPVGPVLVVLPAVARLVLPVGGCRTAQGAGEVARRAERGLGRLDPPG